MLKFQKTHEQKKKSTEQLVFQSVTEKLMQA